MALTALKLIVLLAAVVRAPQQRGDAAPQRREALRAARDGVAQAHVARRRAVEVARSERARARARAVRVVVVAESREHRDDRVLAHAARGEVERGAAAGLVDRHAAHDARVARLDAKEDELRTLEDSSNKRVIKTAVESEYQRNRTRVIEIWKLCHEKHKNELDEDRYDEA